MVVLSRGRTQLDNYSFECGGQNIDVVEEFKYLGITFNTNGRFRKGQLALKEQTTRVMYSVISKIRKLYLPTEMQI